MILQSTHSFVADRHVATPGALDALEEAGMQAANLLSRHYGRDWGEVDEEDWRLNDEALETGNRILSAYRLETGVKVWVITEADRSATTILLPDEY